jgi:TonB family protein
MILALLLALAAPPGMLDPTGSATEDPATPRPEGNSGAWFAVNDYPEAARRAHASGKVGFRIDVDEHGLPVNCTVTESSGDAGLDDGTCVLAMQRGRFIPGHDAAGTTDPRPILQPCELDDVARHGQGGTRHPFRWRT